MRQEVWFSGKSARMITVGGSGKDAFVHREWRTGDVPILKWYQQFGLHGVVQSLAYGGGEKWDYGVGRDQAIAIIERWRKACRRDGYRKLGRLEGTIGHMVPIEDYGIEGGLA